MVPRALLDSRATAPGADVAQREAISKRREYDFNNQKMRAVIDFGVRADVTGFCTGLGIHEG